MATDQVPGSVCFTHRLRVSLEKRTGQLYKRDLKVKALILRIAKQFFTKGKNKKPKKPKPK